jgi:hypothetical protein
MSDKDISAGSRWGRQIDSELESSHFGILCLTSENLNAPWVLFEAGALSKIVSIAKIVPYRLDLTATDVGPPLSQFQGVSADERGTLKLLTSINEARETQLSHDMLQVYFESFWPNLQKQLEAIKPALGASPSPRSDRALLEEILELVRRLQLWPDIAEMAAMSTEELIQCLGEARNSPNEKQSKNEERYLEDKLKIAESELQRRFPSVFRFRGLKASENL